MFTFGFFSSISSLIIALVDVNKSRLFGSLIEFRSFKIFWIPELFDLISLTNRLFNLLILFVVSFKDSLFADNLDSRTNFLATSSILSRSFEEMILLSKIH